MDVPPAHQPPETERVAELLAIIEQETSGRWPRILGWSFLFMLSIEFVCLFFLGFFGHERWFDKLLVPVMFCGFVSGVLRGYGTKRQRQAVGELAQTDDIRAASALLDARVYTSGEVREAVTAALFRLIPRVQASDAPLFTELAHGHLRSMLQTEQIRGFDTGRALVALKALEQVGDKAALPYVRKLAEGKARIARDPEVRQAAVSCLDFLQTRLDTDSNRDTHLRPSSAPEDSPDTLLRASQLRAL